MTTRLTRLRVAIAATVLLLTACGSSEQKIPAEPTPTPTPAATSAATPKKDDPYMRLDQDELDGKLIKAAWDNDLAKARQLIDAGADVNAKDKTMQSAYLIATSEGYLPMLDLTLKNSADVKSLDSWQGTGLIRASERGHAGIVGRLIQADIDADHVNNLGWVGLHEALVFAKDRRRDAYRDTVRVLVAGGADVTVPSRKDGLTPIQLAERNGLEAQARILRGARDAERMNREQADRKLLAAAQSGDADAAALALRAGADLETRNAKRQTSLLLASTHDRVDMARLLVAMGADPDALDHQHDTPWLVTGVTGSVDMLEALLPAQPDFRITNRYGGLSPIPASERGHADYIRRVVKTSIDLDHVNDLGWTALLEAVILGDASKPYQEIAQILVDAGVDLDIVDKKGNTALDNARARGHSEIARILRSG